MTQNGELRGKTVMITGASSGIGAAAGRLFAAEGASVVLTARRGKELSAVADGITAAGGTCLAVPADIRDGDAVRRVVETAVDRFGALHAAFNNAGSGTMGNPLHTMSEDDYARVMDTNVKGLWHCLKHQLAAMVGQGGGAVVNTASTAGVVATGVDATYVASKHAVLGFTKAAAREYGDRGIRVNALVVGSTRTEMLQAVFDINPSAEQAFYERAVQPRLADPKEVAEAALWLCGGRASFVTGAAVAVDGGWTAI